MTKNILLLLLAVVACFGILRADNSHACINFEQSIHDFGVIKANGGKVSCEYQFTNTGDAPLAIIDVTNGGCGCTKPEYPVEPLAPGAKGIIRITFDPLNFKGEIMRTVRVTTNGKPKRAKLTFKADIIPAQ